MRVANLPLIQFLSIAVMSNAHVGLDTPCRSNAGVQYNMRIR